MRYLLDQGLARSTVDHLRKLGIESEHVGSLGLAEASDWDILEEGRRRGCAVVTLDGDFHALLALSGSATPTVIRIRIEGMKGEEVAGIIHRMEELISSEITQGAAVTVTKRRIAVRYLPLNRK